MIQAIKNMFSSKPVVADGDQETRHRGASKALRSLTNFLPLLSSANADLPRVEYNTINARARASVRDNLIAGAYVRRMKISAVGCGLRVYPQVDHVRLGMTVQEAQAISRDIQKRWIDYAYDPTQIDVAGEQNLTELQQVLLISTIVSGNCLVTTPAISRFGGNDLKVRLVESDRLSNPNGTKNTRELIEGVQKDANGLTIGYHVQVDHPGDKDARKEWVYIPRYGGATGRVRANRYRQNVDRPDQVLGISDLAPIIEPLKQLARLSESELMASVINAMFTVFLETDSNNTPATSITDTFGAELVTGGVANASLGYGTSVELPAGQRANFADPKRPNVNFDPFFKAFVTQIGASLGVPGDELLQQYNTSYSAARAVMLNFWRTVYEIRERIVVDFTRWIYGLWFDEEVARGRIAVRDYDLLRSAWTSARFIGEAKGAMDERQEAEASQKRIELGISTEQDEAAASGEDWFELSEKRLSEVKWKEANYSVTPDQYGIMVRAGTMTPNIEDERQMRARFGLSNVTPEIEAAFADSNGVRLPITLQGAEQLPVQAEPIEDQNA